MFLQQAGNSGAFEQLEHVRAGIMEVQQRGKAFSFQIQTLVCSDNSFLSIPVYFTVLRENTCCFTEKKMGQNADSLIKKHPVSPVSFCFCVSSWTDPGSIARVHGL